MRILSVSKHFYESFWKLTNELKSNHRLSFFDLDQFQNMAQGEKSSYLLLHTVPNSPTHSLPSEALLFKNHKNPKDQKSHMMI